MRKSPISILIILAMVFSSFAGYAAEKVQTSAFGSKEFAGQPLRVALTVETAGNNIRITSKLDDESEIRQRLISKYLSLGYYGTAILDSVSGASTSLVASSSVGDASYLKINGVEHGGATGVGISVTASSHGKKTADLGSVWVDTAGNRWTLVRVESTSILNFLPEVTTDANGNWSFPTEVSGKTLTYDAEYPGNYAAHQSSITFFITKERNSGRASY